MAISFSGNAGKQYNTTATGAHNWSGVQQASMFFDLRIDGATPPSIPPGSPFLAKTWNDFEYSFEPGPGPAVVAKFLVIGSSQPSARVNLSIGVSYPVAIVWDGIAGIQTVTTSGLKTVMGNVTGPLASGGNLQMVLGMMSANWHCNWTIGKLYSLDNYAFTDADYTALLNGADPTTIGTSATWRGYWSLSGTTGQTPRIGDAGLSNAIDGTLNFTGVSGTGTAVYAPDLVWAPTATTTPYAATSGKVVVFYPFRSLIDGSQTVPSVVASVPTLTVNGTNLGALTNPWFTAGQSFLFYTTPGNYQIQKTDAVTLNAPSAWCNTPAGAVAAMVNQVIDNRTGRSSVGSDTAQRTLGLGLNHPQAPTAYNLAMYYPLKNQKYKVGWFPNNVGKINGNITGTNGLPVLKLCNPAASNSNTLDNTGYPGQPGLWLVMWDVANVAQPTICGLITGAAAYTTCTERVDLRQRPASGIGWCSVWNVQNIPGNTAGYGGACCAGVDFSFQITDPGGNPSVNYSNLWIVAPDDWSLVNNVPTLDRTDPFALAQTYLNRVPPGTWSARWVNSGPVGGDATFLRDPELIQSPADENWGTLAGHADRVGFSSFGPVNTTATAWIYSPHLGRPGVLGQAFAATLGTAVTTAPPAGTIETWNVLDGATAPLMAGMEMRIGSEEVRIIAGSGTSWTVARGSNLTTPAPHAAGALTVFGRIAITTVLAADGSRNGGTVIGAATADPHSLMTGDKMYSIPGCPPLTMTAGSPQVFPQGASIYVTGPTTLFSAEGGPVTAIPVGISKVNPTTCYWARKQPPAPGIPHEVQARITGKFPRANLHVNLWPNGCDDQIAEVARRVRDNFPAGRKVYPELGNEPWNNAFNENSWHYYHMNPMLFGSQGMTHYGYRALQAHAIFRSVFAAAGREAEIVGVLNCQLGGSDAALYLNYAQANGLVVDAIAIAPYYSTRAIAANATYANSIDDEQLIDMNVHDLWYTANGMTSLVQATKNAIAAYNTATRNHCILIGYEGGIEFVAPNVAPIAHNFERTHDCIYNPNWYIAEQDFYYWLQTMGFDHLHLYGLAIFWGPAAWGIFHGPAQDKGRGDGSDGKFNNLLCRANSSAVHYKGPNVNQDANTVSVRAQALWDWMASLGTTPPPAVPPPDSIQWQGNWFDRWFRGRSTLPEPTADAPPGAPTSLAATASSSSVINLTWQTSSSGPAAASTLIQRSVDGNTWFPRIEVAAEVLAYSDTGLTASTTYHYRLSALNAAGGSPQSSAAQATTTSDVLPIVEHFDTTAVGQRPAGWLRWDSTGSNTDVVAASAAAPSQPNFYAAGTATRKLQVWYGTTVPPDVSVTISLSAPSGNDPSIYSVGVIARVSGPGAASWSGYALMAYSNGGLQIQRFNAGVITVLGTVTAAFSPAVYSITLVCLANTLKGQLLVLTGANAGKYLAPDGSYVPTPTYALNMTDSSPIPGSGYTGFVKWDNVLGASDWFDDFVAQSAAGDSTPPVVSLTAPASGSTISGSVTFAATASDNVAVQRVDFLVDGVVRGTDLTSPYSVSISTLAISNGTHTVAAAAYDTSGNNTTTTPITVTVSNDTAVTRPTIGQALPNIRHYMLDYSGGPADATAGDDETIPFIDVNNIQNSTSLTKCRGINPDMHTLAYHNLSNLYYDRTMDWSNYADANSLNREDAYFHCAVPHVYVNAGGNGTWPARAFYMAFVGTPGSFGNRVVYRAISAMPFPATSGQFAYIGQMGPFREINLASLVTPASGGWTAVLEYCSAIDGSGHPTTWTTITTLTDTTTGLTTAGQITFTPPALWVPCQVVNQVAAFTELLPYRYHYVRWRVTGSGTAPSYSEFFGNDYNGSGYNVPVSGLISGTIPVFDLVADLDGDGYLNEAEWAAHDVTKTARFYYQSRLISQYGDARYACRSTTIGVAHWASDYTNRVILGTAFDTTGIFMDNSNPGTPVQSTIVEAAGDGVADYGAMMNYVWRHMPLHTTLGQRWILMNTAGEPDAGIVELLPFCPAYFLEFYLKFTLDGFSNLDAKAAQVLAFQAATTPPPIGILDLSGDNLHASRIVPQNRYNALCEYYMVSTPETYVSWYGGENPTENWEFKWSRAAEYNIGLPAAPCGVLAQGTFGGHTYKVYSRSFANGTVLWKSNSSTTSYGTNPTVHDLTTIHAAGFKQVSATDGSLGSLITSITMSDGDGAILIPQ